MEKKRPQLNLTELYQLKWILGGALAVLSAWNVLYIDVEAWVWLVAITVAAPVVMRWPVVTLHVPRWVHRLAFPLFVALFAVDFYVNRDPLPAMIRLALMLVLYRTVTFRKRRDDLQLIVLGLFLVVVAGVISSSPAFAVQIVVFTGCTLLFLLVITLIDSAEFGQTSTPAAAAAPPVWMRIEWARLGRRLHEATDWRVALLGSGLFAGVVGLSALLFFALPRFELGNSFFLENMIKAESRTGFSETVRFTQVTDIRNDTSVALRVEVSDRSAIPADPYWRILVLDGYENGVFSATTELMDQMRTQRRRSANVIGSSRPRAGDAVWTFYLEGGTTRYLPLLGSFSQLQFSGGPQEYAINDELRMMRLEKTPAKMFAYRIEGMRFGPALGGVEIVHKRDASSFPQERFEEYEAQGRPPAPMPTFLKVSLDEGDATKVMKMAQALDASPGNAQVFAARACDWLASNHAYALRMSLGEGEDGDLLVRWMASGQPGHCELFAGAFTLLARSAGYPSRMVTGFRGGAWNEGSGHLSIRNSDAHAWCEIFDKAAQSWVRVDPTPGGGVPGAPAPAESTGVVLERIRDTGWTARMDSLRMFWYRRIVDFDQESQVELARGAKHAIETYAKALKTEINARLESLVAWLRRPWDVARLGAWAFVIVTAFALVLGWRGYGRGWWLRWRSLMTRRGVDPVRREAGRWLRRIREAGVDTNPEVRAELERLRYGPRAGWPNPQGAFRRAKRACREIKRQD